MKRRLRADVRIGPDEEEARDDEHGRGGERPPVAERVGEHDERQRERGDRGPRVGEEEADEEQAAEGAQPPRALPGSRDEQRDEEHVRGRERAEEGRDEPAQRPLVAGVVDEVLRQARDSRPVVEPELLREPAGHARVAPGVEWDRVDVDQPPSGDRCGRSEHEQTDPAELVAPEVEAAAEHVRGDRGEGVARAVEDPRDGGVAAEPVLRKQRVEDDEAGEGEREPVGRRST